LPHFPDLSKLPKSVRLGDGPGIPPVEDRLVKQYLLTICYPAGATQPEPQALQKIIQNVIALQKEMQAAGAWVFSGGLHPANTATVLRDQGGDIITTDGPFIESKEQIGGITILRAADLDAALGWARKLARATTTPVEVRPFIEGH